jgi:hypothetical protein
MDTPWLNMIFSEEITICWWMCVHSLNLQKWHYFFERSASKLLSKGIIIDVPTKVRTKKRPCLIIDANKSNLGWAFGY